MKPKDEQPSLLPDLIALMTKIVEQNNVLIEHLAAKEQVIMQLIDQNDEILSELADQDDEEREPPTYLDMDS